jgi:RNA polymerase sigma-70 factor (ECF subfamily)
MNMAAPTGPDAPGGIAEFEAFFRQYERQVVACVWRITGDEQTAHDLSQETFVRAWRHYAQIRGYEQPGAWLLRVATHLALNEQRRRASPTASAAPFADDDAYDALARSDPNLRFVERDLVEQTLLELTPQQRAALVLREVYGFSCEEIGRTLGASRDAIKMTLWRGREQFRLHYLRKGGSL